MKKILWVFLILILLLATVGFNLSRMVEKLANDNIEYLLDTSDSTRLYDYSFKEIKLDVWKGDFQIRGVRVQPRQTVVDSFIKAGHPKRFLVDGQLNDIRLRGLDMIRLLTDQEVSIDSFIITNPVIHVLVDPSVKPDSLGPALSKDLLSQKVTYGNINFLLLKNATISWINANADSSSYFTCDSVSILVKDLYTDSLLMKTTQTLKFSEFVFKGKNFDVGFVENAILTAKGIDFSYSKNQLVLNQVIFKNEGTKKQFTKALKYEAAWYNLKIDTVQLTSKDISRWGYNDYLKIDQATLVNPIIVVYKDKRLVDPPFRVKPLPSKLIRELKIPLLIDRIEVKNGTATYEEIVEKGELPGRIFFTRINLQATNFTNVKSILYRRPNFSVKGSTAFLNKSKIVLHLDFPVLDKRETFYAKGSITNVKATDLNNIVNNMVYAKFKAGDIHAVSFDMTADNERSRGTMTADYTGLKIVLSDTATVNKRKSRMENFFLGLMINSVIRTNNIASSKHHYRTGEIDLARPKNKFILNYIWNSIKVGLITIAVDSRISKKLVEKTNERIIEKETSGTQ
ncbi:MAG TPA: hypothetical protein VK750_06010 [Cytophagaceae bacterium]|jgi:hypothetical protein|nr:hypothetical protein [Cytophagaceae bacterium]